MNNKTNYLNGIKNKMRNKNKFNKNYMITIFNNLIIIINNIYFKIL